MSPKKPSSKKTRFLWPTIGQWKEFPKILTKKEKRAFLIFFILFISSSIFLSFSFYYKNTEIRPAAGGTYTEGLVGQPRFINPVYAMANDVDRDITEIIFSGLVKYDGEGNIVKDLAKDFEIKEDGKVYEFSIDEGLLWSDGEKLTTDDIIFTIETIQNPDYKSPLRAQWLGVEIERISDYKIRFKLNKPSFVFLESTTLKILPKHIWQKISLEDFTLSNYNLEPVGSGPYQLEETKKNKSGFIESITLTRNQNYFGEGQFLSKIRLNFFKDEKDLIKAANRRVIDGFSLINPENYSELPQGNSSTHTIIFPRYLAVFLNVEKSEILKNQEIRKALNLGVNKEEFLFSILSGYGRIIDSPLMPEIYGYSAPLEIYEFDLEQAKQILVKTGFEDLDKNGFREKHVEKDPDFQFSSVLNLKSEGKEVEELQKCLAKDPDIYPNGEITGYFGNSTKQAVIKFQEKYSDDILKPLGLNSGTGKVGPSTIKKLNEICFPSTREEIPLQFSLVTVDQPQLIEIADLLKNQWEELGVRINIETVSVATLERDFIKPREYDSLLFGEVLGSTPDPFPFWHSSQKNDPGLNLSMYENEEADNYLEKGRTSSDFEVRRENYEKFQNILIEDSPAIFLYSPDYLYVTKQEIKGVEIELITDPSKRFSEIQNWYIETKRVWNFSS